MLEQIAGQIHNMIEQIVFDKNINWDTFDWKQRKITIFHLLGVKMLKCDTEPTTILKWVQLFF